MTTYSNTALRTVSFEGNTLSDKAIKMWQEMNPMQRYEVSKNVKSFKSLSLRSRACINYIAEFMIN